MWNFEKFRERAALINEDGVQMTYRELQSESDRLAEEIGNRCLVFLMCSNTIGSVLGYVTFLENGIVPLLLNDHLDKELLTELLNVYQPRFIWAPDQMEKVRGLKKVYSVYGYELLKNENICDHLLHDDLALLLTTSGSTGSRKFVRQSYKNIKINTQQIVESLELDDTERPITTLPMNYTYGCSIINTHLYVGATILLTEKTVLMNGFWSFAINAGATSIAGVPYTYEMLDRLRYLQHYDLPDLRTMTQAGGKLSPKLQEKFTRYALDNGKKFIVMYGACEATARMGYLPFDKAIKKIGSCGIPVPGGTFFLIDADGSVIEEAGVTGELIYKGENVTLGYAEKPDDLSKGDEWNGILETGDMAQRDEDGFYYIVGRKKRFLKVYGNRVNLDEIERMIKMQFDYIDCAVGGVDDHVIIFVTDDLQIEAVKKYVADKTGLNPKAFHILCLESIPKNDSGKTRYAELEKYYPEKIS